ncbi:uncharacterized protein OCT59_009110 [Rhizophagus irregularis]|uniref:uncharacterized protein n=1 Tax=Rhizophagus irregularis TaxID=588596 RepID=UPI000CACDDAC|nr:hypothetical protein OCT59_009110 [Rhizophagus irregularis]
MDEGEFSKILIDELKLLFLRVRNPSDNLLEVLLKTIDPTINPDQLKDYINICRGKFSDFRYNYKSIIVKKAQDLEIHFRSIRLEEFENLLDKIITEDYCRQILATHISCVHKESFENDKVSLNKLFDFVKKSLLIGIKSFFISIDVKGELKKMDNCTSSIKLQSRYHTNIVYNMDL